MNQGLQKRRNPFEKPISTAVKEEPVVEIKEAVEKTEPINEEFVQSPVVEEQIQHFAQQQPVYQQSVQPQYQPEPQYYEQKPQIKQQSHQQRVVSRETKNYYANQQLETREKFTSTMEQSLRRSIKIVCAQRGIMFAQFVEEACREKLKKEGFR